jgi:hypothetical protein
VLNPIENRFSVNPGTKTLPKASNFLRAEVCLMMQSILSRSAILALSVVTISSAATAQQQQQPFPGQYCQAETVVDGDRLLYRTSFIRSENLNVDGPPVEVDLLVNGKYGAQASTRFTSNFTFTGKTETGTPLSFQLDPANEQFQVTHAGRTVVGNCGDLPSEPNIR